jgi:hypothetical protein
LYQIANMIGLKIISPEIYNIFLSLSARHLVRDNPSTAALLVCC